PDSSYYVGVTLRSNKVFATGERFKTSLDRFLQQIDDPESFYDLDTLHIHEATDFTSELSHIIQGLERERVRLIKEARRSFRVGKAAEGLEKRIGNTDPNEALE